MSSADFNVPAIIVGAAIMMAVGALWYSPVLFAKPYLRSFSETPEQLAARVESAGMLPYAVTIGSALVLASVMAWLVSSADADGVGDGALLGFLTWLGFVATSTFSSGAFSGRPWSRSLIDSSFYLVASLANGVLLAVWD